MTKTPLPKEIFVTTKTNDSGFWQNPAIGTRFIIEEVSEVEDDELYFITIVEEELQDDMSAIAQELSSDEWGEFVEMYGLKKADN